MQSSVVEFVILCGRILYLCVGIMRLFNACTCCSCDEKQDDFLLFDYSHALVAPCTHNVMLRVDRYVMLRIFRYVMLRIDRYVVLKIDRYVMLRIDKYNKAIKNVGLQDVCVLTNICPTLQESISSLCFY